MSRLTFTDFAVADWLSRVLNRARRRLGFKAGKHRSVGISTFEWVRMMQVSREC